MAKSRGQTQVSGQTAVWPLGGAGMLVCKFLWKNTVCRHPNYVVLTIHHQKFDIKFCTKFMFVPVCYKSYSYISGYNHKGLCTLIEFSVIDQHNVALNLGCPIPAPSCNF